MAINLLGSMTPPKQQFASLQPINKQYNSLSTPNAQYASLAPKPAPLATSTVTKQPIQGSITPAGVTAKSPTTNVQKPSSVLPTAMANPVKPVIPQTPVMQPITPAANGQQGTASPLYNPNAAAGQAGSLDPTLNKPHSEQNTNTQTQQPTQQYSGSNPVTYPGLVQQAANQSSQANPVYNAASEGLLKSAMSNPLQSGGAYDTYSKAITDYKNFANTLQGQVTDNQNNPIPLEFQTGRDANIKSRNAAQLGNLQSAVQQAQQALGYGIQEQGQQQSGFTSALSGSNTQQGIQQTGLLAAAGLAAPVQVAPGNYLASPLNGGATTAAAGQAQGIKAATDWAIAQQNMAQGRDYQGQAQSISNALQTLKPIKESLTPYMSANNLNSQGEPFANQQINKINQQANPAAYATMQAAINEARSYAIQLLGSQSGANPTDVTSSVNSFDFSNFTPAQLGTFLNNLDTLGQYRLSQAQSASQAGYQANNTVGTPAQGMNANTQNSLESGGANPLSNQPDIVKFIEGSALGATKKTLEALGDAASSAVGSAAGTTISAKVLGLI